MGRGRRDNQKVHMDALLLNLGKYLGANVR